MFTGNSYSFKVLGSLDCVVFVQASLDNEPQFNSVTNSLTCRLGLRKAKVTFQYSTRSAAQFSGQYLVLRLSALVYQV